MAELQFSAALAERGFEVAFDVSAGEVLAILGPNGAGKSTTLHVIAGLLAPDTGLVRLGGRALTDTSAGLQVATHDRRVGLLMQDPLLFPHLSVQANVEFAPRSRGAGRAGARTSATSWLGEVGLAELAGRKPGQLSGGQAQRVAIARALAAEPEVLLLDEPLTGLDVAVAASVRALLRRVCRAQDRSTVLITHDLLDVLTLADRVMVLEDGGVAEIGRVSDVLAAPRSRFGARIAGVNVVRGVRGGPESLRAADGTLWHGLATADPPDGDLVAVFSPAAVAVYRDLPHGSPRNSVQVRVAELDADGARVRVRAEEQSDGAPGLAADITAESAAGLRLAAGDAVWFTVKAQEVALHAAARATS
ncbi:molybdate transport system ATP-binding protein [Mycolicibacterium sp. BK556]|uniref:sulfate/molybdate ABC transporter ATP-binding protein n=1 Tax=unclassified Mycolicibacterium TaxID=2636767 RepID=UPI0016164273|nr:MULTISPECIES: ATP-binding cassette domain-containing protein [unclassified Mycolicibacterium]MBB3604017.1 molybdate transport system ATP-binding protein [Mycolicibacterium sp. BK556]MBB3634213.1 molybdate transport system ATP-binding protein [Mycolicibacterium sp. BK607]